MLSELAADSARKRRPTDLDRTWHSDFRGRRDFKRTKTHRSAVRPLGPEMPLAMSKRRLAGLIAAFLGLVGFASAQNSNLTVTQVAAGSAFSAALLSDGSLRVWGHWGFNQTQNNITGPVTVPTNIGPVKQICAGYGFLAAVLQNGTAVTWDAESPLAVPIGNSSLKAQEVACGLAHTIILYDTTGIYSAGAYNDYVPAGISKVKHVAAGSAISYAMLENGTVMSFGDGPNPGPLAAPAEVKDVQQISAKDFALALFPNGTIVGWGSNDTAFEVPKKLQGNGQFIAAGWGFVAAIDKTNNVFVWGKPINTGPSAKPFPTEGMIATAVAAGWFHGLALTSDGKVRAWGDGAQGQITVPIDIVYDPPVTTTTTVATTTAKPTKTATATVAPSALPATQSDSSPPIGVIVGCIVGGLAGLAILGAALYMYRKHHEKPPPPPPKKAKKGKWVKKRKEGDDVLKSVTVANGEGAASSSAGPSTDGAEWLLMTQKAEEGGHAETEGNEQADETEAADEPTIDNPKAAEQV